MQYLLTTIGIILMVAMVAFMVFYCYMVIKFYRKVWEDKTLLDEYMKQRYGSFGNKYTDEDKEKEE